MALKCNSCGDKLFYNIDKKKLECISCRSVFDVAGYKVKNDAEQAVDYSSGSRMDVFVCNSCGAQLSAPEEQIVAYCNYCGGEALEFSKQTEENIPKGIVPFSISAKTVKEKYLELVQKKLFVPDEFIDDDFLAEFRGIYMPYWSTSVNVESNQFRLKGTKCYTTGGYDYNEEYEINLDINGKVDGGFYDASVSFDDTVAAEIAPFKNKPVKFHEGYLAGFYADTVTSDREDYKKISLEHATKHITDKVSKLVHGVEIDKNVVRKNIVTHNDPESEVTLFPVWFLTWRRGKRVAYSVMNGQTGKLSIDLPIDYKKFFKCAGIQMFIYFMLLCIIPMFFIPLQVAATVSIMNFFTALLFTYELKIICQKEQHVFDLGDKSHRMWKKKIPGLKTSGFKIFLWVCGIIILVYMAIAITELETPSGTMLFILFFALVQLIPTIRGFVSAIGIGNKVAIIVLLFSEIIQFVAVAIAGPSHPQDYWYYGIALVLLAGAIANILTAIYYINYLTTRPVPNFFTREGAKHE